MTPWWKLVAVAFVVLATITWFGPHGEINALTRLVGINPVAIEAGICPRHDATRCTVEPQHRYLAADVSAEPKYGYVAADLSKYGYPADDLSVQPEGPYF